jgi:uncharacterized membrane protein YdbT with pleckstrin-like domain
MATEIEKAILSDKLGVVFEPNETIKWTGKPNLRSYFLNDLKDKFVGLLFIVGVILLFHLIAYLFKATYLWKETLFMFGIVFAISIGATCWDLLNLRTTTYIITDISIVIHKNFYNASTKAIHIKDIQTKEIKKTFVDKRFDTGTILIFTGVTKEDDGKLKKVYDNLNSIHDSENAYVLI